MHEDEELISHELAIAGTRPAMVPYIGMPWTDFVIFCMAAVQCVVMQNSQFLLVVLPLWGLSLGLYKRDYNAGRCFVCWFSETGRQRLAAIMGWLFLLRPADRAAAYYAFNAQSIAPRAHPAFRGILTGTRHG